MTTENDAVQERPNDQQDGAARPTTAVLVAAGATRAVPLLLYVVTFGVLVLNNLLLRPEHKVWPPAWLWIAFGAVPLVTAALAWRADPRPAQLAVLVRVVAGMQAVVPGLVLAGLGPQYVTVLVLSLAAIGVTLAWPARTDGPKGGDR